VGEPNVEDVRRSLDELVATLDGLTGRDPEQQVQGMAIPVLDAAIAYARSVLAGHPVAEAVADVDGELIFLLEDGTHLEVVR
jgi:hypothetical protein